MGKYKIEKLELTNRTCDDHFFIKARVCITHHKYNIFLTSFNEYVDISLVVRYYDDKIDVIRKVTQLDNGEIMWRFKDQLHAFCRSGLTYWSNYTIETKSEDSQPTNVGIEQSDKDNFVNS